MISVLAAYMEEKICNSMFIYAYVKATVNTTVTWLGFDMKMVIYYFWEVTLQVLKAGGYIYTIYKCFIKREPEKERKDGIFMIHRFISARAFQVLCLKARIEMNLVVQNDGLIYLCYVFVTPEIDQHSYFSENA